MMSESVEKSLLPHHEQRPLCTTRLPYRQGRKLTAVKVYTINTESNHLLVFGVPALNLRQETKSLFLKFGNLQQFHISTEHPGELFTETYHAKFDRIQSARVAKRMLDTKNFYGGSLHVCYAPELETLKETRQKLLQRKKDVMNRLKNLNKEKHNVIIEETKTNFIMENQIEAIIETKSTQDKVSNSYGNVIQNEVNTKNYVHKKLDMGVENIIYMNKRKKSKDVNIKKKSKPYHPDSNNIVEVIDFTSTERETLSNINEALNYNKFGNEVIKTVEAKPINRIKFNKLSS